MIAGLVSESQARGRVGGLSPYMTLPSGLEIRPYSSGTSADTSLVRSKARAHIFTSLVVASGLKIEV